MTDQERIKGMIEDLLAMAERAEQEAIYRSDWLGHRSTSERGNMFRFSEDCRSFATELQGRME